jgi:hypothetical protein
MHIQWNNVTWGTLNLFIYSVTEIVYMRFILSGVRLSPLGNAATTGLLYQPQMIDDGDCGAISGLNTDRGNSVKTCPSATLSTTNPTCPDPGSNPGRRGEKPATNRLSYSTAYVHEVAISHCTHSNLYLYSTSLNFNVITYISILST